VHRIADRLFLEPMNQSAANRFLEGADAATGVTQLVERRLSADSAGAGNALGATLAAVRGLADRFGPYRGHEVVYSVPEEGFVRTHLRHFLGDDTLYTRLDVADGVVVGGTDEGAFISGGRGLTPTLAYLGLAPAGERRWTAFDFWKERAVRVEVEPEGLSLRVGERAVRFRRAVHLDSLDR
jgi:hypothetical protein